ncbi:hypothetical protein QRX50_23260 [Amycolatopsis carbonis]|uniref:Uncharacterized protein n=1 Tax=Amycolatopsis carbonis TaxID=715471 RepID=A0A9Y2IN88_9PSEU|nr:hypothetical protein [Amycolatopsis sp. 2-15]WIX83465.1 hypothetical protein QRX50_23260 [Amycolatopsis sp. 2-15]
MRFRCTLERPSSSSPTSEMSISSDVDDDYESLVMTACGLLADTDCRFHIQGFDSVEWPVDVAYDLSVFMEQLPDLLARIRLRSNAELDMYSQGIERTLKFIAKADLVEIHCLSRTDWVPNPSVEIMNKKYLEEMLSRLAVDFAISLAAIGSPIARFQPFSSWVSGSA